MAPTARKFLGCHKSSEDPAKCWPKVDRVVEPKSGSRRNGETAKRHGVTWGDWKMLVNLGSFQIFPHFFYMSKIHFVGSCYLHSAGSEWAIWSNWGIAQTVLGLHLDSDFFQWHPNRRIRPKPNRQSNRPGLRTSRWTQCWPLRVSCVVWKMSNQKHVKASLQEAAIVCWHVFLYTWSLYNRVQGAKVG